MAFFFPNAYAEIDWSRGYESLDTELRQIVRDAALGTRLADKLMKAWRRDGGEQLLLAHVEAQGKPESDFPQRMYIYNYRIFDRYERPVASLAVLTDGSLKWRPQHYEAELWGCRVQMDFPVVKLRDYHTRWAELEASTNPFAIVVMAHLQSQATRRNPEGRLEGKLQLVRRLYERAYARQDVLELFRFIDWVMTLPADLNQRFQTAVEQLEMEMRIPYVTSIERMGIEKGLQQGEALLLQRLLARRFGPLPAWVGLRLAQASQHDLHTWADRLLDAEHLEGVFAEQDKPGPQRSARRKRP